MSNVGCFDENICKNEKRWVNVKHIEKDYNSFDRRGESA